MAEILVKSSLFEILSLIAVFLNCITYILLRNRKGNYDEYLSQIATLNTLILFFFLLEMGLKMFVLGVILPKNSYFKEGWNILDFIVNVGCFLNYTEIWTSLDLSLLRTFRIMRPLKTITSLKKLHIILMAMFSSLPLLLDVFIILFLFFLTYAIAGLQLFSGVLKYRCMQSSTGLLNSQDDVCGNIKCSPDYICAKGLKNINGGIINFDDLTYSFLQVLFVITLDSWTLIMYNIQKSVTNYAWVYFISLVIVGSYVLTNLTLAVIKVKFSETHKMLIQGETSKKKKKVVDIQSYDFTQIKQHGLWFRKGTQEEENKMIKTRIPQIVAVNVDALVENSEKSGSKSVSKMSKNSRMSISPFHSNMNSMNPNRIMNKESLLSIKSPTFMGKRGSALVNKLSGSGNNLGNPNENNIIYRASIISHFEIEEEHSNFIKATIKKTLTKLNMGLQQNFLRFFNYRSKQRRMPKKTMQKIQPKYLKLIVDFDREPEILSLQDVLPSRDENIKKQQLDKQLTILKKTKLPVVYTVRKNSNVLIDLLRKVREHRGSISTELLGSESSSNDLFGMLNKKSIKSMRSVKTKGTIVAVSATKRSSRNLEMLKTFKTTKNNDNMVLTVKKNENRLTESQIKIGGPRKSTMSLQQKELSINIGKSTNALLAPGKKIPEDSTFTSFDMVGSVNPRKSTLSRLGAPVLGKMKKNNEDFATSIVNNYVGAQDKEKKNEKNKNDKPEKDKKGGTMQNLFESNKEKRWTKEQEVMFSLVVGKTKDVDYNFVSIMINAQIENEDDDPTFLNELREEEMDFVKQYLKIRVIY